MDLVARGPYFDELRRGQVFEDGPGVTLSSGLSAVHQSIVGDRLAVALDHGLGRAVSGSGPLAHPALVWDVAIGQSAVVTHFVRANLFYRGLVFRRFPELDDTLHTRTEVVGLKQNATRGDRPRTGLVALRITTTDQEGRSVLDFHRCAMLPLSPNAPDTGQSDDLSTIGAWPDDVMAAVETLDLRPLCARASPVPAAGTAIEVIGGDVVTSAPELARLTTNPAQVHHDAKAAGGRRLVYGGHTIGIAAAQVVRALPGMALFLGWRGCDHPGPVHEGDTLRSVVTIDTVAAHRSGLNVVDLRCKVTADGAPATDVLDWRLTVLA